MLIVPRPLQRGQGIDAPLHCMRHLLLRSSQDPGAALY